MQGSATSRHPAIDDASVDAAAPACRRLRLRGGVASCSVPAKETTMVFYAQNNLQAKSCSPCSSRLTHSVSSVPQLCEHQLECAPPQPAAPQPVALLLIKGSGLLPANPLPPFAHPSQRRSTQWFLSYVQAAAYVNTIIFYWKRSSFFPGAGLVASFPSAAARPTSISLCKQAICFPRWRCRHRQSTRRQPYRRLERPCSSSWTARCLAPPLHSKRHGRFARITSADVHIGQTVPSAHAAGLSTAGRRHISLHAPLGRLQSQYHRR